MDPQKDRANDELNFENIGDAEDLIQRLDRLFARMAQVRAVPRVERERFVVKRATVIAYDGGESQPYIFVVKSDEGRWEYSVDYHPEFFPDKPYVCQVFIHQGDVMRHWTLQQSYAERPDYETVKAFFFQEVAPQVRKLVDDRGKV